MIEDVKHQNSIEHRAVLKRIESVEKNVDELTKFRWQAAAIVGATILIVGIIVPLVDNVLGIPYNGGNQQTQTK
jgi:hypothetical protein